MNLRGTDAPVLAFLSIAACLAIAGCGGSGQSEPPRNQPAEPTGAQVEQGSGKEGDRARDRDGSGGADQSASIDQSGGGSSSSVVQQNSGSSSQSSTGGAGVKTFSGSGSTSLSFNVEQPSRLAWTDVEGASFSARGDGISIDSRAGRGEVELAPGDYQNVKVRGQNWTIVVRPRG